MKRNRQIIDDIRKKLGLGLPQAEPSLTAVSGGDINENYLLIFTADNYNGRQPVAAYFLKIQNRAPENFFKAEAEGLQAIGKIIGAPRVPQVIMQGDVSGSHYLVLEYIESGSSRGTSAAGQLGRELALMHKKYVSAQFGFHSDNYIGRTRQCNNPANSWITFFRDERLLFQISLSEKSGLISGELRKQLDKLLNQIDRILIEPDKPSLLHGDLWGGNWMVDASGNPVLIDPAVYYGHREADLAMTELFGGFGSGFYSAYNEVFPIESGYRERRDLYNLYHMLNHLNLFGRSYESSVRSIVQKYL